MRQLIGDSALAALFGIALLGQPGISSATRQAVSAIQDSTVNLRSDGWNLVGDLAMPTRGHLPGPAVLLLNRAAGNRREYDSLAIRLARAGIASLRLDLRGHGQSINQGTFVPGVAGMDSLLDGTEHDVGVALDFLGHHAGVDSARLGLVGASYSGELALITLRDGRIMPRAIALMSPGSLSLESIAWLERRPQRWLFVASRQERAVATREVIRSVVDSARQADVMLFAPSGHGTLLFNSVPELAPMMASWFSLHLND